MRKNISIFITIIFSLNTACCIGSSSDILGIEEFEASHFWMEKGNYDIQVKAKDIYGAEGEWSEPLPVSIPKYHFNSNLLWLLKNFFDKFHLNIFSNIIFYDSQLKIKNYDYMNKIINNHLNINSFGSILSPEGIIAFSTERDGNYEIYTMRPDGTILDRLTNNPSKDWLPAWSPDGKKLAFVSDRNGNDDIFVMDIAEGDINCLTYDSEYSDLYPDWSPDGSKIVFVSNRDSNFQIYSMYSDGGNPTKLTDIPGNNLGPCWSPDGKKILFSSDYGQGFDNQDIYVMSSDGSNITCLLDDPGPDTLPRWSPDGSTICFASRNRGEDLFLMNADGSERRLLVSRENNDFDPRWSPDGRYIAFGTAYENNNDEVAIVEVSSGEITRLTYSPGWDSTVSWINIDNVPPLKPDKPSGASSGKINDDYIFSSSTVDHDNDSIYYLFDWGDGSNSVWLGLYDSGEKCEASHVWTKEGNFEVKVKAKDTNGAVSSWSDPLSIKIPKNKDLNFLFEKLNFCFNNRYSKLFLKLIKIEVKI